MPQKDIGPGARAGAAGVEKRNAVAKRHAAEHSARRAFWQFQTDEALRKIARFWAVSGRDGAK
jgi:hypothetical protein